MKNFKVNSIFYLPLIFSVLIGYCYLALLGCGVKSNSFYFPALGLNDGRIIILNSITTPVQHTAAMYTLDGEFISVIADTSSDGQAVRGLALFDGANVVVSTDGPDQLNLLNIYTGALTLYASNLQFTGNIYGVWRGIEGTYYAAESNTVEKFVNTQRIPVSGATPYVTTPITTGSETCTIATARGITITVAGHLVVASNGNDDINIYDISGESSATCFEAYQGFGAAVNPIDVYGHSNGNIYITGNGDDTIYEATDENPMVPSSIFNNLGIIDNPIAIAELPNGNLIVASDIHDAIVEITTTGTVVNASFIKDAFTNSVQDIIIIPPQ
ncbi:MAG: hypothetical protein A2Z20_06535 [Bdellovibrionales bacterium RBG_16_40_8]|nr:MAG: hypothetical protein A2Z20_06535 [Bdellovibrionales bacterium RBG_16_40_8]